MKVLVTGATGFIGSNLIEALYCNEELTVIAVSRHQVPHSGVETLVINEPWEEYSWVQTLKGVDVVVHLAGISVESRESDQTFEDVNIKLTRAVFTAAQDAGVKRFIYLSSVKACTEYTSAGQVLSEADPCQPKSPYGSSKYKAELVLEATRSSAIDLIIVRPPLVYGAGVQGNFSALARLASLRMPLPIGSLRSPRSMIYIGNLVNFIEACISFKSSINEVFYVSDGHDLSIAELVAMMRASNSRRACLISVPPALISIIARVLGREEDVARLTYPLQISSERAKKVLGWTPPFNTAEAIRSSI
ncbi:MAG: NAD-dependent epimerase/dehydratase family protein [Oceanospirillaceae bacterium]|nr:NAD-dependent epimerase/dehydratase family protein [Oceanospirillaceae bacterium]